MPATFNPVKIFSCDNSRDLAAEIAQRFKENQEDWNVGQPLGELQTVRFSDGEFQPNFLESVRGCDIFIVQSTNAPSDNLMELLMAVDAAKRASAHYITAVIPYFGFARQDRKDKPRVSIGAKLVANLLETSGISRIMTMDLHAAQIQGFFEVPVDHLDASSIFTPYIQDLELDNLVIASPDMGGSPRARKFANNLLADMVICDKHRKRANQVGAMQLIGEVQDKNVVIVDDIVDTGGTLNAAAQLMLDKGAKSVRACCTHPVLSGKAYEKIANGPLTELIVCDTIPRVSSHEKIKVLSVAQLFARAIHNVYEHKSISTLFSAADGMVED